MVEERLKLEPEVQEIFSCIDARQNFLLSGGAGSGKPAVHKSLLSFDGTKKWLLDFGGGVNAECVLIPEAGARSTLCLSSQAGCSLACTFCQSGSQPLQRNLTAAEIIGQFLHAADGTQQVSSR